MVDLDKAIPMVIQVLNEQFSPYFIILFGSYAHGNRTPESDLDIAFLSEKESDLYVCFLTAQTLSEKIGVPVDLVDLQAASTVLRAQIMSTGKMIDVKDPLKKDKFHMYTYSQYARLNEERRPILERTAKEGKIFDR